MDGSGPQGCGSRRRGALLGAAGADGGQGVGALPLQLPQVQPDGVLGASQGGHQEEPAGWKAGRTAERNHQEQEATQVGEPRDDLQRPGGTSALTMLLDADTGMCILQFLPHKKESVVG